MILSRIAKALKAQNWLAVGIEFVIVILGVVIGFQISAWNDDRADRERAQALTVRLIAELRGEQWRVHGTSLYNQGVRDNARQAVAVLEGRREADDGTLVIEAFRATQIFSFPKIRATYEELVSTGAIQLIEDGALMSAAVEYYDSGLEEIGLQDHERPYRRAFLQLVDSALYSALADACAEPLSLTIGDYQALDGILATPCEIDGHEAEITALAARLRQSEILVPLLRQRAVEAEVEVRSQVYWQTLFERVLPPGEARGGVPSAMPG